MDGLEVIIFTDSAEYDLKRFDCGDDSLNAFLVEQLGRQHEMEILKAYVMKAKDGPKILGYYTLSGSCFERESFPSKSQQKKIPYKNTPSITLGRLAIDNSMQGKGYGDLLVTHAMRVVYQASMAVGIHGLFVDALNDRAKSFYQHLGFIALTGNNSNSLFYPTKSIKSLFEDNE